MVRKPKGSRKLLVASIGVATMTYVGTNCGGAISSVPNGGDDGAVDDSSRGPMNISGNLVAPMPVDGTVSNEPHMYVSGNLVSPPSMPTTARTADSSGPDPRLAKERMATDAAAADSARDSPTDATTPDSPEDSAPDTGPSTFDVIDDWPIANLILPPVEGGV